MTNACQELAARLAKCFAVMAEAIEVQILSQMIRGGDAFCSYSFEVEEVTLRGLCAELRKDIRLWGDFQSAVQAHRPKTHWAVLLEHVYTVGCVIGKLRILQKGLSCPCPEERRKLAKYLNCLDGEVALCRELADRRNLAVRISRSADFPTIDGLTFRGLTYVFGEYGDLWRDFKAFVENAGVTSFTRDAV